jgi:LPXTG-site transpeptidase (sortase) family protein
MFHSTMQRRMIYLGVICAMVFGLALPTHTAQATVNPPIVWVDDTNNVGNCAASGHTWGTDCFATIQNGITAVAAGGTIYVAPGMYTERVFIDKALTILGATAVVNKNGYPIPAGYAWDTSAESVINYPNPAGLGVDTVLVDIQADNVVFRGFVVQILNARVNSDHLLRLNAGIPGSGTLNNVTVENNILGPVTNVASQNGTYGRMGLYFSSPSYPAQRQGITNTHVSGNTIFNALGNGNNIFIWGSAHAYGSLQNADYTGTVIEDNDIFGSHRSGIEIAGGVSGLVIRNNRIHDNSSTNGGSLDANLKYGNAIVIIRMGGDKADSSALGINGLTITGNEIYNNEKNGIYSGPFVQNMTLDGNNIHDNGQDGIRIDLTEAYYGGSPAYDKTTGIDANGLSLSGNDLNGIRVIGTPTNGFSLDATDTWWGCLAGPGTPGCDGMSGAVISGTTCGIENCNSYPVVVTSPVATVIDPGPASFSIVFNEDVRDLFGNTDPDDVTNPENYLLVKAAANGEFHTLSCAGNLVPDDSKIDVDEVLNNSETHTATVNINAGVPLADGIYKLFVCGTTSIVDLAGVPLNGGDDIVYNFRVGASSTDPATLAAAAVPATGFAPYQVTNLPTQSTAYAELGDLWLEIPRLGVQMPIVGVPQSNGIWDVTWLGDDAGWLDGTAFPTWAGNSVLTGHVVDANGKAGPFRYLNTLWYSDQVVVHAWGAEYVYEVRGVSQVGPGSTAQMLKHEELPWVTLVTCRGYDEATNSYKYRVLVRAVLVDVK